MSKNERTVFNPIDNLFEEGVRFTVEARNYIAHKERSLKAFGLPEQLEQSYQQSRISSRLIQVMNWLLAMKAVNSGEISREQFREKAFRLGGKVECTDDSVPEQADKALRSLLERSYNLYMRVKRLDEVACGMQSVPTKAEGVYFLYGHGEDLCPDGEDLTEKCSAGISTIRLHYDFGDTGTDVYVFKDAENGGDDV